MAVDREAVDPLPRCPFRRDRRPPERGGTLKVKPIIDHRSYSAKIGEMLEQHVHVTGLSITIRLRDITDPEFANDSDTGEKTGGELQEAFVRKSAELRRVTREQVDKNPAQYGSFSEHA